MDQPSEFLEPSNPPRLSKSQKRKARQAEKLSKDGGSACGAKPLTAKTPNQRHYIDLLRRGANLFGIGPAGTGKTYIAARIAARALLDNKIKKIIIARVTVPPNQRHAQGFLPGKLDDKLAPWMIPVLDGIKAEVSVATLDKWRNDHKVEFCAWETLRGRSFHGAFILVDEAQNTTVADMKLMMTRVGEDCQVVVTGDIEQIDIRDSGLVKIMQMAVDYDVPMDIVEFGPDDVVRSVFTRAWVRAFACEEGREVSGSRIP